MNSEQTTVETNQVTERSDEELWSDYIDGSEEAFIELRSRYRDSIFRYLLLSGIDTRDAAQMLGQIFCYMAAYRERPEGFDSIKEWIFAVTTQQALPAHVPDEQGFIGFIRELNDGQPTSQLERARRDLNDMQRDIRQPFLLVAVFGLGIEEAARACRFRPDKTAAKVELGFRRLAGSNSFIGEQM